MPAEALLLQTKLDVPLIRGHLVARDRLLAHLPATPGTRLVLLSAPAGFGKTTLLAAWCHALAASGRATAWLALDAGDNDLLCFLTYLRAAVVRAAPPAGMLLTAKPSAGSRFLTELLNALAALEHDLVLVLDDYHAIESPAIHAAVAFLLDHLPEHACLALGSRTDPPLPIARLRAREQLVELRSSQLCFTPDETRTVLGTRCDEARALCAYAEGWPAGIQLLAHGLRASALVPGGGPPGSRFDAAQHHVFAYLADDVFGHLAPHLKTFLLQTSVLDRMCAPLCDAVMGVEGEMLDHDAIGHDSYSRLVLEEIERANLFLLPLDDEHRWYRFHHLFRAFLQARLALEPPSTLAELHRRASRWLEQQRLWAEASEHARAAGDGAHAAALGEHALCGSAGGQHDWPALGWAERELGRSQPLSVPVARHTTLDAASQTHKASEPEHLLALTQHPSPPLLVEALSERELEVLRLIAAGASNQAVAHTLVISLGTVKSHINHILGKLAASNRTEAVAHARNLGILQE